MKLSERWLREWVNPPATAAELAHKLNMAGLECEAEPLFAQPATGVVVGRIISATQHPQADRLRVCMVDVGSGTPQQIVCGAANARAGLFAPTALPGAVLPGGMEIKQAQLRGVDSSGMLCSAKELLLAAASDGLLELDDAAIPGTAIETYLGLVDNQLTLDLTPNRGDCLSIAGLAREAAALYGLKACRPTVSPAAVTSKQTIAVTIKNPADCSAYAGRVISGINPLARTPDWLREKLRRSGIRCIHPVVDISNLVMLELGQPMHAFDLAKISGGIVVRRATAGEQCKLLTEETITLGNELLITDEKGALALAGVMGGFDSGVGAATTDIFFESAAFLPAAVVGVARRHKLSSDAAYRFERGVDPALHREALERATALTLAICGGSAGPVSFAGSAAPKMPVIVLKRSRLLRLLGQDYSSEEILTLLTSLGVHCEPSGPEEWRCTPPSWRFDLAIEQDLMEEVARIKGYDHIEAKPYAAALVPAANTEARRSPSRIKDALVARGWQEAITYSFVDANLQTRLKPEEPAIQLDNPIAETMNVMRTTLWTGLIGAWRHNHARQNTRVRFFELAATFAERGGAVIQTPRLAGLAAGMARPEQWGEAARPVDFYDVKADLEALTALFGAEASLYQFERGSHPALHPGRCAQLLRAGELVGVLGEMHPMLVQALDLPGAPILFELDWNLLGKAGVPLAHAVSEFPSSRRDLAVVVDEAVPVASLLAAISAGAGSQLAEVRVFDIYRGKGLEATSKSIAFGLIFQDLSRTLNVEEVDAAVAAVVAELGKRHNAVLRN